MLRPSLTEILKDGENYYSLVVAIAKRARELAGDAQEKNIELDEKPVKMAVREFAEGDCRMIDRHDPVDTAV
ncbi:DNA-directed RNA polymerase subunit omega [Candidatus Soleaferrea massiliensis]|uniref:DNA-directed RNA polymerase subunit omega n=1 Tax=Candidatus Soleaferrea massiliensis TaxID=1470354 RepID=UPI00058BB3FA|nr:DNA-directed RNA polymerase subunit omega [Candidatus Soleaferrea massiliensis]